MGHQRQLHLLEVPLQLTDLILSRRIRNHLVIVAVGNTLCRVCKHDQRQQLTVDYHTAEHEEE